MNSLQNNLLLRAARGEKTERTPVWLMRQAGRILPQYRAVRENLDGFKALVTNPERCCEVTIQPVDELGVDAAIIFSDILVIPEALGLTYEMEEKKGPRFPKTIEKQADIDALLGGEEAASHLEYVYEALRLTKSALNGRVPLIGFSGAPWTLFAYMVEGSGSKTFSKAKKFLYTEPAMAHALLNKITEATIYYLKNQVKAGADLIQIFDSWAGILSPAQYREFSLPYISKICDAIHTEVPVTVFAKDAWYALNDISLLNCNVIGLDWTITPEFAKTKVLNNKTFQGNIDPCLLYASHDVIKKETHKMLASFSQPHIANLGHGVYPDTPLDGVKCFVEAVMSYER
jgi:uroporphyrinogen decarboxylase